MGRLSLHQREELALALALTITAHVFRDWYVFHHLWALTSLELIPWHWYLGLLFLGLGLLLALSTPAKSGLRIGAVRQHWRAVLLVCGGSVLITALVYPQLPVRPWTNQPVTMWLISPLAQQLIFAGYLYGRLEGAFPGHIHPRVRISKALVLVGIFFAAFHLPNFLLLPRGYVLFQLFYTGVLGVVPGLARQWTGSIYYGVLTHSAINFIAWYAS